MRVGHVVAWTDRGDLSRRRSFEWTQSYWRDLFVEMDVEFIVSSPEPFTRPKAINEAVARSDAEVFLQTDPDSVVVPNQAIAAIQAAAASPGLVVAFDRWLYLTRFSSRAMMAENVSNLETEEEGPGGVGNVVAFSRDTWATVDGFDERFDGVWGGCDGAFAYACSTIVAPLRRVDGPMYHLWHPRPPESQPGHPEYVRQMTLLGEYRDAAGDVDAMTRLIASRQPA